jgi:hypothetical protein
LLNKRLIRIALVLAIILTYILMIAIPAYAAAPSLTTQQPSYVLLTGAVLQGTLDNLNGNTDVYAYFEYGLTTSYGTQTTATHLIAVDNFSATVLGLNPNATYHYRAVVRYATTSIANGADVSFITHTEASSTTTISSTPTLLQINQCDAYRYLQEPYNANDTSRYDMAFFIDFTVTYPDPQPTEPISDTYIIKLMDTDGSTEITTAVPYAFFNNGYNRGIAYIYLTADEVDTAGLVWGSAYQIRLDGNPLASWDAGTPSASALTTIQWTTATTQGATRLVVEAKIRSLASALQTTWNDSDFIMLANYASGGVLTTVGESYFSVVIPNLNDIAPSVLSATNAEPEYIDRQYGNTNEQNIISEVAGTSLDMTNLANVIKPGLDPMVISAIIALAVLVFVAIKTRDTAQSYKPIVLISIPVIVVLTRLHFIALWLTILLAFIAGVMVFYTFFYEKSSG